MSDHEENKQSMVKRLARIEGQIRGIKRLVEEDSDCEKVAQQMTAARRALDKAFHEMLACMIEEEVVTSSENGTAEIKMSEIKRIFSKYA